MRKTIWVLDDAKATALIEQGCTVTEVARRLQVSRQTIYVAIKRGRIPRPHGGPLGDDIPDDGTRASHVCAGSSPDPG